MGAEWFVCDCREGEGGVGVQGPILRGFVGHCKDFGLTLGEMGREWRVLSRKVIQYT